MTSSWRPPSDYCRARRTDFQPANSMSTPTVPKFDSKSAAGVRPFHNEKTLQRTVAFHQEAGKSVHIFSATGLFIATLGTDEAAAFAAQAKKTDADSRAAVKKANDEAHE